MLDHAENAAGLQRAVHRRESLRRIAEIHPVVHVAESHHEVAAPRRCDIAAIGTQRGDGHLAVQIRPAGELRREAREAGCDILIARDRGHLRDVQLAGVGQQWREDFRVPAAGPGHTSATVMSGLMPKNSRVSSGCRQDVAGAVVGRAMFAAPARVRWRRPSTMSRGGGGRGGAGRRRRGAVRLRSRAGAWPVPRSTGKSHGRQPIAISATKENRTPHGGVRIEVESLVVSLVRRCRED